MSLTQYSYFLTVISRCSRYILASCSSLTCALTIASSFCVWPYNDSYCWEGTKLSLTTLMKQRISYSVIKEGVMCQLVSEYSSANSEKSQSSGNISSSETKIKSWIMRLLCSTSLLFFLLMRICSSMFLNYLQAERVRLTVVIIIQNMEAKNLAIPFITYQEGAGFTLTPQAEQFLTSLPQNRKLGIISIVGRYRTGKSFFVNRVLLDQMKGGFQVGPTINPCTKGLWLWKKTIQSETHEDTDIIVIDTQGFGGMDQNANHDSRIFLFSLLLSSYFIYNSVGSIDENALNNLNLIINLAKDIQTKSNNGQDVASFPAFLWVVRDFTLMLQDKNGEKISKKEYLENALQLQKGSSQAVENKNKIRRHLKQFFTDRDCQIMVRPTEQEKDLQRLDQIENTRLRPEFVTQVNAIRKKIFQSVKVKKINDRSLSGGLLVTLCKGYMQTINKGHLPSVESAWFYVCRNEGMKAIRQSTDLLEKEVHQLLKQTIDISKLDLVKKDLLEKVRATFKKRAMGSEESHPDLIEKLQKKFEENFEDLVRKNKRSWQAKYTEQAERTIQILKDRVYNDEYEDFGQFCQDLEEMKRDFDQSTRQGDPVEKWKQFNELSEYLYKTAGEMITSRLNKNLNHEKAVLQQKLQMQERELEERHNELESEKASLKGQLQQLSKETAKTAAMEESHKARALQYKQEHDKLYEKYRSLHEQHEELETQFSNFKRENRKASEGEAEEARNQLNRIRTTLEKERTLHEVEKKYMEEELARHQERASHLENQCRKLRTANARVTSQLEEAEGRLEERKQEVEILQSSNEGFSKKIEVLLEENSRKSELAGDHSEWLLEKNYLQNQVAFLKNSIRENKELHDKLLLTIQQTLTSNDNDNDNYQELVEANKNLSSALEKLEGRYRVLEEKYEKAREFKRMVKEQGLQSGPFLKDRPALESNQEQVIVSVTQQVREGEGRKSTEYVLQVGWGSSKWKTSKRSKQFIELHQMLIHRFPSIKYPASCNFILDFNQLSSGKRNVGSEERRRSIQQYMRDLIKIDEIRNSDIFREFLRAEQGGKKSASKELGQQKREKVYLH